MSLETSIQQLKDAVEKEIAALEARIAAAPTEIPRGQEVAAKLVKSLPAGAADLKSSSTGFMLRVGKVHSVIGELHVAITYSGHISVAFRANRFGKALPDEHWELLDPTAGGEHWPRIFIKFCERTAGLTAGT